MERGRLFNKITESEELKKEIDAFDRITKTPVWDILPDVPPTCGAIATTRVGQCIGVEKFSGEMLEMELSKILIAIREAKEKKDIEQFQCGSHIRGFCCPLILDDEVFGYILLCGLPREMSVSSCKIFKAFTGLVVRKNRSEIEIEDINMTVRPRAIALSTVHTLYRLITSILDMDQLLPGIARLTLQVLRANRCSIKLVDQKRKQLIPSVTIDLRKAKAKLKKVMIGKYAPGRSVKKGMPVRGKNYLAVPLIDEDVIGVITLYDKVDNSEFTHFDEEIMKTLCEQAVVAIKNAQLFKEQEDLTLSSISCIAQILENRPHGVKHPEASFRKLIHIIGPKFNMNESELKMLQYAALLHDAGQISIPEKILMKRGELTGKELDMVKAHPLRGANVLSKFKPLKPIVPIILYHHESWDGKGYPKGLKGKDIPLAARILAVVSSFEAMITKKPYRKAMSIPKAVEEVRRNAGKQFDPSIVKVFCEAMNRKDVRKLLAKELGNE